MTDETEFCVHSIINQVRDVVASTPEDQRETALIDQFQAGVHDLMADLLHEPPSPEQMEGGVAAIWIASQRLDGLSDRGYLDPQSARVAKLALAEVMTAISVAYRAPAVLTAAEFEKMYGGTPVAPGA